MKLAYDAQGQRFRKQIGSNPAVYFAYDLQGQLLGEYTLSGSTFKPLMEYIWLEGQPVAAVRPMPGAPANAPNSAQEVFYLHTDHLGTPRVALDTAGRVRWRWMGGEPFGLSPAEIAPTAGLSELNINLRLPGQQYDGFVGLHYNYFRDYDPTTGRYVQPDPLGVLPGAEVPMPNVAEFSPLQRTALTRPRFQLNQPYAYVDSNPAMQVDPNGLEPTTVGRIGIGAVSGGIRGARGGLVGAGIGIGIGVMAEMCSPTDRDRDERQCDADYVAGRSFCHAMAVTKGRHKGTKKYAETYAQCMRAVEEAYVECYQKAGK